MSCNVGHVAKNVALCCTALHALRGATPGRLTASAKESGGNEFFQFPVAVLWPLELQFAKKPRFITMLGSHRWEPRFLAPWCRFLIE